MLFEVAIITQPSKKEIEEGTGTEKLVFGPKFVIAKDAQSAALAAIMGDPEVQAKNIDMQRAQVLVRPFA